MSKVDLVRNIYLGYISGDIPLILANLSEDIEWSSEARHEVAPWHGVYRGKLGVEKFFTRLLEAIEVTDFSPLSLAENESDAFCVIKFGFRVRSNGLSTVMQLHHWWRFRDGKIYYYRGSEDTEDISRLLAGKA